MDWRGDLRNDETKTIREYTFSKYNWSAMNANRETKSMNLIR